MQLDAAIMRGSDCSVGAVAALERCVLQWWDKPLLTTIIMSQIDARYGGVMSIQIIVIFMCQHC